MIHVTQRGGGALVQAVCPVCSRSIEQVIGIPEGASVEGRLVVSMGTHVQKACGSFLVLDFPAFAEPAPEAGAGLLREDPLSA